MENLASRVLYMQEAKEDVRSDISVMKRAAEKAHGEVTQAEQLKKKQVLILHQVIILFYAQSFHRKVKLTLFFVLYNPAGFLGRPSDAES